MKTKKKNKRIALLCYSLKLGGAEKNTLTLQHTLTKSGYSVDTLTVDSTNDFKNVFHIEPPLCLGMRLPKLLNALYALLHLLYIAKKNDYVLFIVTLEYIPLYIGVIVSLLYRKKIIYINGTPLGKTTHNQIMFRRPLLSFLFNKLNAIIVVSQGLCSELTKLFPSVINKTFVVYNSTPKIKLCEREKNPYLITAMGRLVKEKGFLELIDAFTKVKSALPQAKLTIIGNGPQENILRQRIENLGLSEDVNITGFVRRPSLFLSHSSLFVCTSYYEGFGNSIIEAMSCRNAIISFDTPHGPQEILQNNMFGLLIKKRSVRNLSSSILQLLRNKSLLKKYQKLAHRRSLAFSETRMIEKYKRIIEKLI